MKQLILFCSILVLFSCGNSDLIMTTPNPNTGYPYTVALEKENGEIITSNTLLKAKPTVVLFWMTTCGPCKREIKALSQKVPQWKTEMDFDIVLVSRDFPKNHSRVWELKNQGTWPFETFIDKERVFGEDMPGALNGLPQLFLYNEKGDIIYNTRKYRPGDEDKLYNELKKLIG